MWKGGARFTGTLEEDNALLSIKAFELTNLLEGAHHVSIILSIAAL